MKKLLPRWLMRNASADSLFKTKSKSLLVALVFVLGGITSASAQGYDLKLAQQCNSASPGTIEVLTFTGTIGNANGDGTLTIESIGDLGAGSEYVDYYDENNVLIGTSSSTTGNCNIDYFTYTMPLADILSFSADGKIEVEVRPSSGVHNNQCTSQIGSASYCSTGRLIYPTVTGPNDAGVSAIDSPDVFCSGVQNIVATIENYGTNQITSVVINWKFDNITQTPITYSSVLDTVNGVGSSSAQVVLGTKTFIAGNKVPIEVWTTLPNNKVDTSIVNDSTVGDFQPSLSGNFTINPSGTGNGNYVSFTDALNDLTQFGVCGPVTFNVSPGTYNEQLNFTKITGASATNTVTFIGDTTNSGGVTVEYGATGTTDNFVLQLDGVEYVTINGFKFQNASGGSTSYRRILHMLNGASYNTIINSHLVGYGTSSSSSNYSVFYCYGAGHNYNKFINNKIDANGQYYGTYFYGGSTSATNIGNEFIGNEFTGAYYYGVLIYYHTDTKFKYNSVNSTNYSATGTSYGVYSYYGYNNLEFVGNKIHFGYYGLRMYYTYGSPTESPLVANNWITAGTGGQRTYPLYLYNMNFGRIVNNTVWQNPSPSYGYYGIYVSQGTSNMLVNNLVYSPNISSSYYGIYVASSSAISEMDYNNVFTNANYGYYNGAQNDLTAWKNAGGGDHSYDFDPAFTVLDSLRHCNDSLDNTGKPLEFLMYDIDMDLRDPLTPDIGADEFVGSDSSSYSAGLDGELCNGAPIAIGAPITGSTYQWSTGSTDSMIQVSTPGDYTVILTSSCGGTFTDVVSVSDITPSSSFNIDYSFQSGSFTNTSNGPDATYMWVVDAAGINDTVWGKDLIYVFDDNGPYEICLTTMNKCDTVSSCKMWQGTVGIADTKLDRNINMFPNPTSNNVTIQFNEINGDNLTIELINIQGQVVYTNNLVDIKGSGTETMDVSSLNSGVYMVRFVTDSDIATKQLVVK